MCNLRQTTAIACLATLFQLSVSAQNASVAAIAKELAAKSSAATSSQASALDESPAPSSDAVTKAANDDNASSAPTAAEPKVQIKNPALELGDIAPAAQLIERPFTTPDAAQLRGPQTFRATAYSLRGRTRLGTYVRRGVIAADPRVLPLGSVVQLNAGRYSGVYSVHDTGKKIKGKIVDVWMPSSGEARQFGRRGIKLQVLRLGHGQHSNKK